MLSDSDIRDLAGRMAIPLAFVDFKTELENDTLQYNKAYIINMEDEFDKDGERNGGTHWTCFQVMKYPNGKKEPIYFDSYGKPPPQAVEKFVGQKMPYNHKDIQSLMGSVCGYFCLAFLHWINHPDGPGRTGHLYTDCESFTDLFEDLEKSHDHLKNEYVLSHFFRSSDPEMRKKNPVDILKGKRK